MRLKACIAATLVLTVASLFSGCQLLQSNATAQAAVSASVEFVTGKYIQSAGAAAQQTARATLIASLAKDIGAAASANAAGSVAALQTQISALIAAKNYDPATAALISGLVAAVIPELQQIESTQPGQTAATSVQQIVGWVELACSWYGAPTS